MTVEIDRVAELSSPFEDLVGELDEALSGPYTPDQHHALALDQLLAPNVLMFMARLDGAPAGIGGVARYDGFAEVKRMYVRPAARGHGIAKAVLQRLEGEARLWGEPLLRLETGIHQHEAIGLYERSGFRRCPPFGHYLAKPAQSIETSIFYEKPL